MDDMFGGDDRLKKQEAMAPVEFLKPIGLTGAENVLNQESPLASMQGPLEAIGLRLELSRKTEGKSSSSDEQPPAQPGGFNMKKFDNITTALVGAGAFVGFLFMGASPIESLIMAGIGAGLAHLKSHNIQNEFKNKKKK